MDAQRPVIGISRPIDPPRVTGLKRIASDLSSVDELTASLESGKAGGDDTTVFHLAGMSSIEECQKNPMLAFEANVRSTMVLLETMRRAGLRRIVFASSGVVYAPGPGEIIDESWPVSPRSIYSATKIASEALVKSYSEAFGFHCAIARMSNVYGAGMSTGAIIGQLLDQAVRQVPLSVRNTSPVRDFIYVKDAASALLAIAGSLRSPGCATYNVSSGTGVSVGELASAVSKVAGLTAPVIETMPGEMNGAKSLVLSNELLRREVGWAPVHELDSSLAASFEQLTNPENET
jgi:UDP-glucose 4-epimerase